MNPLEEYSKSLPQILMQAVEEAAVLAIDVVKRRVKAGKDETGSLFSNPYSRSHKSRREKAGKQTSIKNFNYSGTMMESLDVVDKVSGNSFAKIVVGFTGQANRRPDQSGATNQQVGEWLSDYEGKSIIRLSEKEQRDIAEHIRDKFIDTVKSIQFND